ncbi:MAG: hypothetical protein WAV08_09030, partial [Desulfobacterales bacterium]
MLQGVTGSPCALKKTCKRFNVSSAGPARPQGRALRWGPETRLGRAAARFGCSAAPSRPGRIKRRNPKMFESGDLKKGVKIEIDGDPYVIVQFEFVKPGKG